MNLLAHIKAGKYNSNDRNGMNAVGIIDNQPRECCPWITHH